MKNIIKFVKRHKKEIGLGVASLITGVIAIKATMEVSKKMQKAKHEKEDITNDINTCAEFGEAVDYTEQEIQNDEFIKD